MSESESKFVRLIREAINTVVEKPLQEALNNINATIAEYEEADRQFKAQRVQHSTEVFTTSSPYSRQNFLDSVKKLEELRLLAELARDGRRELAGLERVTPEVSRHLAAMIVGPKVIERIQNEAESDKILGVLTEGGRGDTLAAQKQSLLLHIDQIVRLLQEAGWKPTQADYGVIGAERKKLGATTQPKVKNWAA